MEEAKILIVEDDLVIQHLVKHLFVREGVRVLTADCGLDALRAFRNERPDLVILDLMLPDIDGWEVCRRMQSLQDTPVIMLSALQQPDETLPFPAPAIVDYMEKPFWPKQLLAQARAALNLPDTPTQSDSS